MNIYTTNNFELVRTINVNPTNKGSFEGLFDTHVNQIMIIDEETYLVRTSTFIREFADKAVEQKDDKKIYFYLMGDDGRLIASPPNLSLTSVEFDKLRSMP